MKSTQTWSAFNQALSKCDPDLTTVGYMPLIQAPAHHLDTINTVVQRCMHISEKLGKKYTVISVDQALYFKLMSLSLSFKNSNNGEEAISREPGK
jgi:hypothetical protein